MRPSSRSGQAWISTQGWRPTLTQTWNTATSRRDQVSSKVDAQPANHCSRIRIYSAGRKDLQARDLSPGSGDPVEDLGHALST